MYKTVITDPAQKDINEALTYISKELKNSQAALRLLDLIENEVKALSDMPARRALIDDEVLSKQGFRFIKIKNYLLFYVVREETKTVVVERFLYARRNWTGILKQK